MMWRFAGRRQSLARYSESASRSRTWIGTLTQDSGILAYWYPHLFFLFCFEELGAFGICFCDRWQDAKLIASIIG